MGIAKEVADRYFDAVNGGDLDLMRSLFADHAVLVHPSGTYEGVEAITGFYRDTVMAFQTVVTATTVFESGPRCLVEFEGRSPLGQPDQVVYACDVFTLGDAGTIEALHIYYR